MNVKLIALAAGMAGFATPGFAQTNSVLIYGIIDAGITHYSSAKKTGATPAATTTGPLWKMDTGVAQGSRLGFKGVEDLGGGSTAFFNLENGFNIDDGSAGQGGLLFGRQAFVGLGNDKLGSVSLGRQYDFMVNLSTFSIGGTTPAGLVGFGLHVYSSGGGALNDRIYAGDRINNSIKYTSPTLGGASFGAMFGLGEVAGSTTAGRSYSVRGSYENGPLNAGFAFTDINNEAATSSTRTAGVGASYRFGDIRTFGLVTQAKITSGTAPKATNYELGLSYALSPLVELSGAYQLQKRNNGLGNAKQLTLVGDYRLSKRTDVYLALARVKDNAFPAQAVAGVGNPSENDRQSVVRVGVRHIF